MIKNQTEKSASIGIKELAEIDEAITHGKITLNDARKQLGLKPIDGGDILITQKG